MALEKARKVLEQELSRVKGQVGKIEAVLALIGGNGHHVGRKKFKHTEATKRRIAASQRKRMAALRK